MSTTSKYLGSLILLAFSGFLSGADIVSGPATDYTILSGNIPVHYSLQDNLPGRYLGLYKQGSSSEIARQTVQVNEGIVQFRCDAIFSTGQYNVKLFKVTGEELSLSEPVLFSAVWPKFNLTLPTFHIAQESIHPQLTSAYSGKRIACKSQIIKNTFNFEVEFSQDDSFIELKVIHQERDIILRSLNSNSHSFRCELFDRAGFYRVSLKEDNSGEVLSMSNVMAVTWGDYYKMSSTQTSVFPCRDKLVVEYSRPSCVTMDDNIHMYAARADSTGQQDLEYMYEAKAPVANTSVSFDCDDIRKYQWTNRPSAYCFRYQTVASNQAVADHDLFCLATNNTVGLRIDGNWSKWSNWSECSGNCEWGRQSRYRYCNSPTPINGGKFCDGGVSMEWRRCQSSCKTALIPQPLPPHATSRPGNKVPACWCGCTMSASLGLLIPGRQCSGNENYQVHVVWLIQAAADSVIKLNITDFKWGFDGQMLRVRDGFSYNDKLLVDLKGNHNYDNQYLTSSGSYLHIEFMSNEPVPVQPDLFIAAYSAISGTDNSSPHFWTSNTSMGPDKMQWKLSAIIGGVIAGVVLIAIVIGACVYRHIRIARVIKRSQGENTSPNHVVMQVQSGEYIKFGDVTPSVHTVQGLKHSPHTSSQQPATVSSRTEHRTQGHRPKRLRRQQLPGIKEHSALTIPRPLPDPYNVKPEDFLHQSDLLHVSASSTLADSQNLLNRNITIATTPRKHKLKKRPKKRRQKQRQVIYDDPQEVDNLINSLPVGATAQYTQPIDPDSSDCFPLLEIEMIEYRALINHLSSTGSHNQSELVNTSAEVHPVPHTTPVEDTSQELSPLIQISANAVNGQRSPCLDDGYNSLANTGSTQSNLSSRDRELPEPSRLNRIKERPGNKSENSLELSPSLNNQSQLRHSTHGGDSLTLHHQRYSTHSCGTVAEQQTILQLSHITCPLQRPDGASDDEMDTPSTCMDDSLPPSIDIALLNQSSPKHQSALAPPDHFADTSNDCSMNKSIRGSKPVYIKKLIDSAATSHSNTTSDSYEYDDYLPPPATRAHESMHSDLSWPQPPIAEEAFIA